MSRLAFAVAGCIAVIAINGCKAIAPRTKTSDTRVQQGHKAASLFATQLEFIQVRGYEFGRPELQVNSNVKQITFKDDRGEAKYSFDESSHLTSRSFPDKDGTSEYVLSYKDEKLVFINAISENGKPYATWQYIYGDNGDLIKELIDITGISKRTANYRYEMSGRLQKVISESNGRPPIVWTIDDETGQIVSISERPNIFSFDPKSPGIYTSPNVVTSYYSCVAYQPPFF